MSTQGEKLVLLEDQDVAGSGTPQTATIGGRSILATNGTFDGATVTFEFLGPDGTNFITVSSGVFSAAGSIAVDVAQGTQLRATLAGGTNPENIYADAVRVPL